jgi:hypothetical protein
MVILYPLLLQMRGSGASQHFPIYIYIYLARSYMFLY